MHQFHLPNPALLMSQQQAPILKPELIHLAPIRQETPEQHHYDLSAGSRRPSTSSNSSSQRTFLGSRSASPAFSSYSGLEQSHGSISLPSSQTSINEQYLPPSYPHFEPPKQGVRCPRCLQGSETVWVAPGKACPRCHTPIHDKLAISSRQAATKASKKKRADRKQHSRLNLMDPNAPRVPKRDGEAGRRYDHAYALGVLQRTLLDTNPNLVKTAAPVFGSAKSGWSSLKNNNICWDVRKNEGIDPLLYNKMDIFGTSKLVHEQSNAMLVDVVAEIDSVRLSAQRSCPPIAHTLADLLERINRACKTRGEQTWVSPSDMLSSEAAALRL